MPGIAIGEAKSVDAVLTAAEAQVDDYLAGGKESRQASRTPVTL